MNLIPSRAAQCGTVAFFKNGQKPFVPLITVPVTITAAGQLLVAFGQFTLSSRRDDSQGYPGFPHPYTAGGMLLLTASDPSGLVDVPLSSGLQLDPPTVRDGFPGGGTDTSPMSPYVNHNRIAAYVTTEADVGQRWITMLGYCSSTYAQASDYLLNETMEIALSVINGGVASQSTISSAPVPLVPSTPPAPILSPPPPPRPAPPPPVSPPPAAPLPSPSPWQSIIDFIMGRK
jgi:hypothetical protein